MASGEGLSQSITVERFDADDFDVGWSDAFDVSCNTGEEASSTNAAEDGIDIGHVCLTADFDCNRTLAGNDAGMVEGRDDGQTVCLG